MDNAEAERKAAGLPKELSPETGKSMRSAHEKVHGEVEDYEYPSKDYLAWRFSQFENGELLPERK